MVSPERRKGAEPGNCKLVPRLDTIVPEGPFLWVADCDCPCRFISGCYGPRNRAEYDTWESGGPWDDPANEFQAHYHLDQLRLVFERFHAKHEPLSTHRVCRNGYLWGAGAALG